MNFAVIEDGIVINTIVAESKAIAEEVTGLTCIEYTTEPAEPGGTYSNGTFISRKPYPSWVSDGGSGWNPPVAYPEQLDFDNPKFYSWDEDSVSWVENEVA
jgi:hypothetical protein